MDISNVVKAPELYCYTVGCKNSGKVSPEQYDHNQNCMVCGDPVHAPIPRVAKA